MFKGEKNYAAQDLGALKDIRRTHMRESPRSPFSLSLEKICLLATIMKSKINLETMKSDVGIHDMTSHIVIRGKEPHGPKYEGMAIMSPGIVQRHDMEELVSHKVQRGLKQRSEIQLDVVKRAAIGEDHSRIRRKTGYMQL